MAHSSSNQHSSEGISTSIVGERVYEFLRTKYPQRTAENVSADLIWWKISTFTVRTMLERQTAPGAILWCALIDAYGANFLAAALPKPMGWIDDAARAQRKAELESRMAALRNELERL